MPSPPPRWRTVAFSLVLPCGRPRALTDEPPFAKVLNYSTFSVRYNESTLQHGQGMVQLKETLLAIPEPRRREMLANVQAVQVAFRYGIPIAPYTPDSMTEVLMFQLWAKKHGHDFNPEYHAWESSLLVNPK